MAALDFPDTPVVGDIYGSWRWDGARWTSSGAGAGVKGVVAYAESVTDQGSITTMVDVAGLLVSFPMVAGRRYRTTVHLYSWSGVVNDTGALSLKTGATQLQSTISFLPSAGVPFKAHLEHSFVAATTGSRTMGVQYGRNSGTGTHTVTGRADYPAFIMVEDVTYEAGSGSSGVILTPWLPATLLNAWVAYTAGNRPLPTAYRRNGDYVDLRVHVASGATGTAIFQLPVGYRPPETTDLIGRDAGASNSGVVFNVDTSGNVTWYGATGGANAIVSLQDRFCLTP